MKRILLFSFTILLLLASCGTKNNYPKEIRNIFKAHGGLKAWKNVKTVSFSVGEEVFTLDITSGKKVITAPTYSLGFDGVNYWLLQKEEFFDKNPKEYLQTITNTFLVPFLLETIENPMIDKEKSIITFEERDKIHFDKKKYHIQSFLLKDEFRIYKEWQDVVGFRLPKIVRIGNKELQFSSVLLSQATFADGFYEKPINQ